MDYICIKYCYSVYLNVIHHYHAGEEYKYSRSLNNKGYIHDNNKTFGYIENNFIEDNFIKKSEYNSILQEVDELYDLYLIYTPTKTKQLIIDNFYKNI